MNRSGLGSWKWLNMLALIVLALPVAVSQPEVDARYDIYALNIETGGIFQVSYLANRGEFNPSWSPDGRFIVHDVLDLTATPVQSLGITNVTTGETVMLQGGEGGNNAVWSPNGQWIAFDLYPGFGHGEDARIFVVPAGGGERRFVTDNAVSPSWSHDSKMLVFEVPWEGAVYTVDISGANRQQILPGPNKFLWSPKWSPDGQWIFCGAWGYGPEENWGQLFKIRVDNKGNAVGEPQYVTVFGGGLTLSNNSKKIVQDFGGEIWSFAIIGGIWSQVVSPTGSGYGDWDPAFSNNGLYIAFGRYTAPLEKSGLSSELALPSSLSLAQNYPNPFNPATTIKYELPERSHVTLTVFNMLGQKVATLVQEEQGAGHHEAVFDGSTLASGVYLYRLQAGEYVRSMRMTILK